MLEDKAFLLYKKPFKENSFLATFLTKCNSITHSIVRENKNNSYTYNIINQLYITFKEKDDLILVKNCEILNFYDIPIRHYFLVSYINELIIKLVPYGLQDSKMFIAYKQFIEQLASNDSHIIVLRNFEFFLFDYLGHGIDFEFNLFDRKPIVKNQMYQFYNFAGFINCYKKEQDNDLFCGEDLLNIRVKNWTKSTLLVAKKLISQLKSHHLGDKILNSQKIYQEIINKN